MKLVIVIACSFAVVLAAPRPDQQSQSDQQQQELDQQSRRRWQGLRLKLADGPVLSRQEERNDRYNDRDEDYLRKVSRGSLKVAYHPASVYTRNYQLQQPFHDLGSLSFRYYSPSSNYVARSDSADRYSRSSSYLARSDSADRNQASSYQSDYRGVYLRQDDDPEDDPEQD